MSAYQFLDLLWHVLLICTVGGSAALGIVLIGTALDYETPTKKVTP